MKHPLLAGLAASGWRTGMVFLALSVAAVATFGTPVALKSALQDSGAYQKAADSLAGQASKAISDQTGQATDEQAVEAAAKDAISAMSLQNEAEQNIDSAYIWLEGKTDKPDIKVDLRPYIGSFTQKVGDQALQHTESLPVCTVEQLRQIDPSKADVLNLPCRPPGINLDNATDKAISDATQSSNFLSNPVITTDSLPKDSEGKTAIDRAARLPDAYAWGVRAPWIFGGLALLSALIFVLIVRPEWRLAFSRLGRSLFFAGILVAIVAAAASWLLPYLIKSSNASGDEFRDAFLAFANSIGKAFGDKLLWFAAVYLAVGAVGWLVCRFVWKPAKTGTKPADSPDKPQPSGTAINQPEPAETAATAVAEAANRPTGHEIADGAKRPATAPTLPPKTGK